MLHPTMPQDFFGQNLRGRSFKGQNLEGANFSGADIRSCDFTGANLRGANFSHATAGLQRRWAIFLVCVSWLLYGVSGFFSAFLGYFVAWSFNGSNPNLGNQLSGWTGLKANLSHTNLSGVQALGTDFTGANFTGACIENWNINRATNLTDVICDYIYLREGQQERRPSDINKNFAPGEFTKLFQKVQETVDLIFRDGINWQAFLTSFQKLQVESGGKELSIQAIENKNDGAFVIRVNVPRDANKAVIENYLKRGYDLALVAIEDKYKNQLQLKDEQIALYHQQNTNLMELAKLNAKQPIQNFIHVTANAESKSMSEGSKRIVNNNQGAQFAGGQVNAETVTAHQIGGDITNYTPEQKQTLAQAAADIQELLNQLGQTYPTNTPLEKQIVVTEVLKEIERNPTLKARVIGALKAGGTEALKELLDHPAVNILLAALEGWQDAE